MYAIIRTGGKQSKVHEGDVIDVERLKTAGDSVEFTPLLVVDKLRKIYTRGVLNKQVTFELEADFTIDGPAIVGTMGPNGSGKTTTIGMMDQLTIDLTLTESHRERLEHQVAADAPAHRPTHDAARVQIHHYRQVQPALARPDKRNV